MHALEVTEFSSCCEPRLIELHLFALSSILRISFFCERLERELKEKEIRHVILHATIDGEKDLKKKTKQKRKRKENEISSNKSFVSQCYTM